MRLFHELFPLLVAIALMGLAVFALPYPGSAIVLTIAAVGAMRALYEIRISAKRDP